MNKKTFLLDTLDTEDKFEVHTKICNVLYGKITKINEKGETVNIGLFGEWGSGKSFIIKKLKQKLEMDKICVYEFDAWKFNGKALERSILFDLEKQAFNGEKRYFYKKKYTLPQKLNSKIQIESEIKVDYSDIQEKFKILSKNIITPFCIIIIANIIMDLQIGPIKLFTKEISKLLSQGMIDFIKVVWQSLLLISTSLAVPTIILKLLEGDIKNFLKALLLRREDVKEEIQQTFSSEEFESIFKDMINQIKKSSGNQIVIIFDNIDRCEPKYAYEIITTIKTYMSISECIYIIPCDDEALKSYLGYNDLKINDRNYEQEFLDKFFNVNIRIPSLSNENLDDYIGECLDELDLNILEKNKNIIKQLLFYAYRHQNPRKIKRFINDFSMYYSLALEVDKERKFILNDVEMFTIISSIKQCWPILEKKLIEDVSFRSNFYTDEVFRERIKSEIGEDVVEFLMKIKPLFYNDKPIYSYLYYKESNDEIKIVDMIRNGLPVEMNHYNFRILEQYYKNYNKKDEHIYKSFLIASIFYSIKEYKGNKLREFQNLFNQIILSIDPTDNPKEYNFIENFTQEDWVYFDKIDLCDKSLDNFRIGVYQYTKGHSSFNENKVMELLHSDKLKYSHYINEYLSELEFKSENIEKCIEFILENNNNKENIVNYFSKNGYEIILESVISKEKIKINNGKININNNALEFIYNKIKKSNRIIHECIFNNFIGIAANDIGEIEENQLYNIGILIMEISKYSDIKMYEPFVLNFLNTYPNIENKIKLIYYSLIGLYKKKSFEEYGNKLFNNTYKLNNFIEESLSMFGEDYFITNIYLKGSIGNVQGEDLELLIENISEECLVKNFKNIGLLPVFKGEMEALISKLKNHEEGKSLLSLRMYDSLCEMDNEDKIELSWMEELKEAYKLIKNMKLLDYAMIGDNNVLLRLYKIYPDEVYEIICDCIKFNESNKVYLGKILDFINKKVELNEQISDYKSVGYIAKNNKNLLNKSDLHTIENILSYILKLGRSDDEYDIAYELLSIYAEDLPIDKYKVYIDDLVENKREKFYIFAKKEVYEEAE